MSMLIGILVSLVLFNVDAGAMDVSNLSPCNFPAIYNFGDSNSDTSSSQFSNGGILLIEFMTNYLRLPSLSAYIKNGTIQHDANFQHGANFATAGAPITKPDDSYPWDLGIQIKHFHQLKARANDLYNQGKNTNTSKLPKPEDFSKALYTLDIGQNDLTNCYTQKLDVRAQIPNSINQLAIGIKNLYQQGARTFWIHSTGPFGCFIGFIEHFKLAVNKTKDQNNCYTFNNEMSSDFNRQLNEMVNKLRIELPDAVLTYVDLYTPMYQLLTNYTKLGFANLKSVLFDTVHRTQAANQWLANRVLNGSMSDPSIPITHACHKRMDA